jgi:hypothetical protein
MHLFLLPSHLLRTDLTSRTKGSFKGALLPNRRIIKIFFVIFLITKKLPNKFLALRINISFSRILITRAESLFYGFFLGRENCFNSIIVKFVLKTPEAIFLNDGFELRKLYQM